MAVRTGGEGASGLSLLVVPLLNTEGVTMQRMKTTGSSASGTTFIELDDVKVPVENLIGKARLENANFLAEKKVMLTSVHSHRKAKV
jgi:alkylation response protein AidB-like acyl-CoA dehydrogenase